MLTDTWNGLEAKRSEGDQVLKKCYCQTKVFDYSSGAITFGYSSLHEEEGSNSYAVPKEGMSPNTSLEVAKQDTQMKGEKQGEEKWTRQLSPESGIRA